MNLKNVQKSVAATRKALSLQLVKRTGRLEALVMFPEEERENEVGWVWHPWGKASV